MLQYSLFESPRGAASLLATRSGSVATASVAAATLNNLVIILFLPRSPHGSRAVRQASSRLTGFRFAGATSIRGALRNQTIGIRNRAEASSIAARGLWSTNCSRPLLEFDDLYPVRAAPDRVTTGLAKLSGSLIDFVDGNAVRLFAGGNEILALRIDPDAARLSFGGKVADVSQLAGIGRHGEQGDLAG